VTATPTTAPADPVFTRARARVRQCSRAGLYTAPAVDAAARLLVAMEAAGDAHGITRDAWSGVTDLPGACLDVTADKFRGVDHVHQVATEQGYPNAASLAIHLVDVLERELVDVRAVPGVHRPGPYGVTFSTCGRMRRSIKCGADGWHYDCDGPGRIEHVYAPHTEEGARAVAELIAGLVAGTTIDPLARRL
jgi:hypothetical protein